MVKKPKSKSSNPAKPTSTERPTTPRVIRVVDSPVESLPVVDDSGLSLEEIGQAYAALLNRGDDPYEEAQATSEPAPEETPATDDILPALEAPLPIPASDNDGCEISPKSILEAMLFVGHPLNEPLTAKHVASLMRGVRADEIEEHIHELNAEYLAEQCPYYIASEGSGYRLTLREEFSDIREQFYGKTKEAKLSQAAIDTLSIVAYHQPIGQVEIDAIRSKPSGGLLNQLVRRGLISLERTTEKPRKVLYRTTLRFLELFGLESLDDLPRSQEMERES
jgi:segregation and condensation protein B